MMNNRKSITLPIECWLVVLNILKEDLIDKQHVYYSNAQVNEDHVKMVTFIRDTIDEITNQVV